VVRGLRKSFGAKEAVAAVLFQVLFCITLARLVTTSMAGLLRSPPRQGPRRLPGHPDLRAGLAVDPVARPRVVTVDTTTQSSRVRGTALPLARYGLRGAVTARVWIYQRREPASLVFWAMTAVIMAAVSARARLGRVGWVRPAWPLTPPGRARTSPSAPNASGLRSPRSRPAGKSSLPPAPSLRNLVN
jgi:hypothetical protein